MGMLATDATFRDLLLELGQQKCSRTVPKLIVQRLGELEPVALARIWLLGPGDICDVCHMQPECPDQTDCLRLEASAGRSIAEPDADWSRTDGFFRRFPVGVRKVGQIAATGAPVEVAEVRADCRWLARPVWAKREGIRGFGGQPLIHQGEVLGVLGVFTRIGLDGEALLWLRTLADHVAIALANARAFERIESLRAQLELENEYLREEVHEGRAFGDIVGRSPALERVIEQIDLVAPTDARVLITGESGTGKELVAREVHRRSARRDRPMIKVNCASIPAELYESEFFGHVRGSFTGAVKDRAGRFAAANGGTLFLDEIGEIPLGLQSKLLRVLQEGQFERVGDDKTRHVDVRVVAATNRDLAAEVEAGRFRQDLYYRINVFPIEVAPLRERGDDIPLLVEHFLGSAARKFNRPPPRFTKAHAARLQDYDWPGNVRELQNVVERALITARGGRLRFDLPVDPRTPPKHRSARSSAERGDAEIASAGEMKRRERANILVALEQSGWRVYGADGAAELLGVKPTTLAYRMKRLGLERPR